jgi:hypothetical protein
VTELGWTWDFSVLLEVAEDEAVSEVEDEELVCGASSVLKTAICGIKSQGL